MYQMCVVSRLKMLLLLGLTYCCSFKGFGSNIVILLLMMVEDVVELGPKVGWMCGNDADVGGVAI